MIGGAAFAFGAGFVMAAMQAGAPALGLDPDPVVEIGASASNPDDQLFGVGRVLRVAEGGFLVVEGELGRIRVYDAQGRFVRDLGGLGDGPGEFRNIVDATLAGDALLVLDRDGSVTRLALDGRVLATRRPSLAGLTGERYNPVPYAVLPGGEVLVRAQERVFGRPDGAYVQEVGWLGLAPQGGADTLGFFPSHPVRSDEGLPRPFRPWVEAAARSGGGALWVSVPAEGRLVDPVRGLEIRLPPETRAPTGADLGLFRESYLARGGSANDRRVIAEWVDGAPVAERLPAFRRFTVDGLGRAWVERWPAADGRSAWHVFDRDGTLTRTLEAASRLRVEDAGRDWLVGVWIDDFGVETVRLYALRDGGA